MERTTLLRQFFSSFFYQAWEEEHDDVDDVLREYVRLNRGRPELLALPDALEWLIRRFPDEHELELYIRNDCQAYGVPNRDVATWIQRMITLLRQAS